MIGKKKNVNKDRKILQNLKELEKKIIYHKTQMSSAESLFKSFVIMSICLLSSVIITEFILAPGEMVAQQVQSTGIEDAPLQWSTSGLIDFCWNVGYFLTYVLDFYAVGQFIWVAIRKQRYDIYGNEIDTVDEGDF